MPEGIGYDFDMMQDMQPEYPFEDMMDQYEDPMLTHFDNIIDEFDNDEIEALAVDLMDKIKSHEDSRQPWMDFYKASAEKHSIPTKNLDNKSTVTAVDSSIIAEGAIQFQSELIIDTLPSEKKWVVGKILAKESNPELDERRERFEDRVDHALKNEIPGFYETISRLGGLLPLLGRLYLKIYPNADNTKIFVDLIYGDELIVDPETTIMETSEMFTHEIKYTRRKFDKYVQAGTYRDIPMSDSDNDASTGQMMEGTEPSNEINDIVELYEVHTYLDLEDDDERPYIITMERDKESIISIRRNYYPDTPNERVDYFVAFGFIEGPNFYSLSLEHVMGSMDTAINNARKQILIQAEMENCPPIVGDEAIMKKLNKDDFINRGPGSIIGIPAVGGKVADSFAPLPVATPSRVLIESMMQMDGNVRRFLHLTDVDGSNNKSATEIEVMNAAGQAHRNAIHQGFHRSLSKVYEIIARELGNQMTDELEEYAHGSLIHISDLDRMIEIQPISDPSGLSEAQRRARDHQRMQWAQLFPNQFNIPKLLEKADENLGGNEGDEILIGKIPDPDPADATTENIRISQGQPVKVYPDDPDVAHVVEHFWYLTNDMLLANPLYQEQMGIIATMVAHIRDHMNALMNKIIKRSLGLNPLEPIQDRNMQIQVSEMAAQLIQQNPDIIPTIDALLQGNQVDPAALQQRLSEIKIQEAEMLSQIKLDTEQQKTLNDLQAERMKIEMEMATAEIQNSIKNNTSAQEAWNKIQAQQQSQMEDLRNQQRSNQEDEAHEKSMNEIELQFQVDKLTLELEKEREKVRLMKEKEASKPKPKAE